jgi:hypothetical protein
MGGEGCSLGGGGGGWATGAAALLASTRISMSGPKPMDRTAPRGMDVRVPRHWLALQMSNDSEDSRTRAPEVVSSAEAPAWRTTTVG